MATSAAHECGADQTVDHVVFQCPIHRPPHGLHGLTMAQTTGCSTLALRSSAAKQWTERTGSNDDDDEAACDCVL